MKIKDPQQARTLKHNNLVALMLERNVRLRRMQPPVPRFCPLHLGIEIIQEPISEELVVDEIELTAGVVEAVIVAGTREVEPLGMAKLVAFEVEVAFAAETVRDEPNHFVEGEAALDDRGEGGERGHVGVELGVAEPHEKRLVTDESG